jgi:hypothetical protein
MITELLNRNPWRFKAGDTCYVANWPQKPVKVTAAVAHNGWPHYLVVDHQGGEWTLPQQCLSRSLIAS